MILAKPILEYKILKAHSKRIHSNFNFIKFFFDDLEGFLLSQIESDSS